jgi:large subunit ribosomal protein L18
MSTQKKVKNRIKRQMHIRKKISGTALRPRISVFRSSKHIYVQAIDDENSKTLASSSDYSEKASKVDKSKKASKVGKDFAVILSEKGIKEAVFDRRGYKYHGRVKSLAEAIREGGIKL